MYYNWDRDKSRANSWRGNHLWHEERPGTGGLNVNTRIMSWVSGIIVLASVITVILWGFIPGAEQITHPQSTLVNIGIMLIGTFTSYFWARLNTEEALHLKERQIERRDDQLKSHAKQSSRQLYRIRDSFDKISILIDEAAQTRDFSASSQNSPRLDAYQMHGATIKETADQCFFTTKDLIRSLTDFAPDEVGEIQDELRQEGRQP